MTQFETLAIIALLAFIAYLLLQIRGRLLSQSQEDAARRTAQEVERRAAAHFPTLWSDPDLWDEIVAWHEANRTGDDARLQEWHWDTLAERAQAYKTLLPAPAPDEYEDVIQKSIIFLDHCEDSRLTSSEARFLVFRLWHEYFHDPTLLTPHDFRFSHFSGALADLRLKFIERRPN